MILDRIGDADALLLNLCPTPGAACRSASGFLDLVRKAREKHTPKVLQRIMGLWKLILGVFGDLVAPLPG